MVYKQVKKLLNLIKNIVSPLNYEYFSLSY